MVFNFAYITYEDDFDKDAAMAFHKRIREISSTPFNEMAKWSKEKGFENIPLKIRKDIPPGFEEEVEKVKGKYTVIRLYKSNYPTKGRIIGKLVNKVFYIFYIDVKGDLYKH